jgi:hypothetical protein
MLQLQALVLVHCFWQCYTPILFLSLRCVERANLYCPDLMLCQIKK